MSIRNIGNAYGHQLRPAGVDRGLHRGQGEQAPAAPEAPAAPRTDSVEISDAGRALGTDAPRGASQAVRGAALGDERVAELRRKVLEGAYNSVDAVDQVARRILSSGDV